MKSVNRDEEGKLFSGTSKKSNRGLKLKQPYILLLFPGTSLLIFFFVIPLAWMFAISFYEKIPGGYIRPAFTLENYLRFLTDAFYLVNVLYLTLELAILSTILAVILGYPIAYFLARSRSRCLGWLLALVLVPLWVSVVIRVFGWMIILMDTGVINQFLIRTSILSEPIRFMYTKRGVLIALTQISIPFVTLSLLGVLQGIDPTLEEAAQSLGANKVQTFLRITLPLSVPGILAGSLLAFAINVSSFVIPFLMGGGRVRMLALMAYEQAMVYGNLPFAAAMGFILLVIALVSIVLYLKILKRIYAYTEK